MDESSIALGVCQNQVVIGSVKTNYSYMNTPENCECVTLVECVSATGRKLSPLVISKGQNLQTTWFNRMNVPDMLYINSENGWISNRNCLRWLKENILPAKAVKEHAKGVWRLLLLDNHVSHVTTEFTWECFKNKVQIFFFPPHSTHVLQPLDLACFSAVKSQYRSQIAALAGLDDSAPVKKEQFLECCSEARNGGLTAHNVLAGWKAAGIRPWDSRKVIRSSQVAAVAAVSPLSPQTPTRVRRLTVAGPTEPTIETPQNGRHLRSQLASHPQCKPSLFS